MPENRNALGMLEQEAKGTLQLLGAMNKEANRKRGLSDKGQLPRACGPLQGV